MPFSFFSSRSSVSSLSSIALLLVATAPLSCGGTTDPAPPPANDGGNDTAKPDAIVVDSKTDNGTETIDTGPVIDISGTTDISIRVVKPTATTPEPQAGFAVRAENQAGGFLEANTGADGIAHLKVDAAKGPFDVTAAKKDFGAVSVLGVTGPVGDVLVFDLTDTSTANINVTGAVTGADPANQIQVDGWNFATAIVKPGVTTYATKYGYDAKKVLDLPLAAIEVDATGKAVNAVLTPSIPRTGSAMKIDVAFPATKLVPAASTLTVKFPTTGIVTGKQLTTVAKVTGDMYLGNCIVVQSNGGAQMFVGIGNTDTPVATGNATIKLQTFGGSLKPDLVTAAWSGGGYFVRVGLGNLADASSIDIGSVTKLEAAGATLGDVVFSSAGTGWEDTELALSNADNQKTVWHLYGSGGGKLDSRGLPHLPSTVKLDDISTGVSSINALMVLWHRKVTTTPIWSDNAGRDAVVSKTGDTLDTAGR